ncbi:hypothetical protein [Oceanicella sp. SM1341]|uniref:hypothetical protein n=1 Tax=Oceanicella sp. SM1341 TaxID=1548889 RepID=UPI000E470363|nr:hypothetical protein [Oceanicella sp. SM1341]
MTDESRKRVLRELMRRHGQSYCSEIGIRIGRGTPAPLFRLLVASMLFSARISAAQAAEAARALTDAGLGSPARMAAASWQERVDVLTSHGYARYDESTSRMLGETADMVQEQYGGDLRRLREAAGRDPGEEARLLTGFKGLGPVGAEIFLREVQLAWDEVYPRIDDRAGTSARALGLPGEAAALSRLVPRKDFARLAAALVRSGHARDADDIRATADKDG